MSMKIPINFQRENFHILRIIIWITPIKLVELFRKIVGEMRNM